MGIALPAAQCFHLEDCAVCSINNGLKVHDDLTAFHGLTQTGLEVSRARSDVSISGRNCMNWFLPADFAAYIAMSAFFSSSEDPVWPATADDIPRLALTAMPFGWALGSRVKSRRIGVSVGIWVWLLLE